MNRLQEKYNNEIVPAMIEKFGYKNIMQVPKLNKIVINMGVGEAKDNSKVLDSAVKDLEIIAPECATIPAISLNTDNKRFTRILIPDTFIAVCCSHEAVFSVSCIIVLFSVCSINRTSF